MSEEDRHEVVRTFAEQRPEGTGKLRKTIILRDEYTKLKVTHPELAQELLELDQMLENLLVPCEEYDRWVNDTEEDSPGSEWGTRIMRCRYVIGAD